MLTRGVLNHLRHRPRTHNDNETQTKTAARRKRRSTIGLAAAAALAIAVHVGLGGAILAAPPWTGLAADVVLALVVLKVIAVTVIALRHRARRGGKAVDAPVSSGSLDTSKLMLRSEVRIPTPRGERYGKQLCSHAARMNCRAEWSPPQGVIKFPDDMGICRVIAGPDHLVLAVEATDSASLDRLQQILSRNIERFGNREGLKMEWVQDYA
jgi:hypothetical protein